MGDLLRATSGAQVEATPSLDPAEQHTSTMASKPGSRWANAEKDAELDAKLKHEKEEKRRKKLQKQAEKEQQLKQQAAQRTENDNDDRPSKRRKLTPERAADPNNAAAGSESKDTGPTKLLRFDAAGSWGKSRSVENYEKLNDIEEGTYGWVARATDKRNGTVVALKRLKLDAGDRGGLPVTGLREIQILKDCRHRNIVELKEVVVGDDLSKLDKYVF